MDHERFDDLARAAAQGLSRRQLLRGVGGLVLVELVAMITGFFGRFWPASAAQAAPAQADGVSTYLPSIQVEPPPTASLLDDAATQAVLVRAQTDVDYLAIENHLKAEGFVADGESAGALVSSDKHAAVGVISRYTHATIPDFTAQLFYVDDEVGDASGQVTAMAMRAGARAGATFSENGSLVGYVRIEDDGIPQSTVRREKTNLERSVCELFCDVAEGLSTPGAGGCESVAAALCWEFGPGDLLCFPIATALCEGSGTLCSSANPCEVFGDGMCRGAFSKDCGDNCVPSQCPCEGVPMLCAPNANELPKLRVCADLLTDVGHCGSCSNNCLDHPHVTAAVCENGKCRATACEDGYHVYDGQCVRDVCRDVDCGEGRYCCPHPDGERWNCCADGWVCCGPDAGPASGCCPAGSQCCRDGTGELGCCPAEMICTPNGCEVPDESPCRGDLVFCGPPQNQCCRAGSLCCFTSTLCCSAGSGVVEGYCQIEPRGCIATASPGCANCPWEFETERRIAGIDT